MSKFKMSFYDWCINNNRTELLDQWDYTKNDQFPKDISCGSSRGYFFLCPQHKHESEECIIHNITRTKTTRTCCSKCSSFAQYLIDMYGVKALDQYWDYELNQISPWEISAKTNTMVYIKCQKTDYHGSYMVSTRHFIVDNVRCSYCFHRKVHPKDSFAQYGINKYGEDFLERYWDFKKNKYNPWEISPMTSKDLYIKCIHNAHHDSFRVASNNFFNETYICPHCLKERKNIKIQLLENVRDGLVDYDTVKDQIGCFEDLRGRQFGRLTVISLDYQKMIDILRFDKKYVYYWICKCSCDGNNSVKSISADHLKRGLIVSCGCWKVERVTGENHPNWKGGVNSENHKARYTEEGNVWRREVLKRDNFACQCCGQTDKLNAHHLYNFADNIDLRYNIDNGIVLCEDCHGITVKNSFHNIYGAKNNTPHQLREYIFNKIGLDIYITHPHILNIITQQND